MTDVRDKSLTALMELSGTDGATVIRVIDGEVYYVPIEATELDPTTLTIVVWDPDDDNYWEAEDGHSGHLTLGAQFAI